MMKTKKYTYLSLVLGILMALPQVVLGAPRSASTSKLKTAELGKAPVEQNWNGSIRTGMSKNQDKYSDYFSSTKLSLSRVLRNGKSLSVETAYSQPVSDDQDKVKYYGIDDLDIFMGWDQLMKFNDAGALSGGFGLIIPSSRTSRYASMNGAGYGALLTTWKLPNRFNFKTSHSLSLYSYKYDTANADGDTYNAPFGLSNGAQIGWNFKKLKLGTGFSLYYTQNYAGTEIWVQAFTASMAYSITESISTALGFRWKDRVLTNNSLFDDDTTVTSLSVAYSF